MTRRAAAVRGDLRVPRCSRRCRGSEKQIVELVEATYRLHGAGDSVNPPSYFLRFPDRPTSRIIALPASIGGDVRVDGLKWISSFPENVAAGIPRASAVLILNDHDTGYPFAVPGELDHQRHPHGRVRGAGRRLAQPGARPPDPGRVHRHRADHPLHPHVPRRHRVVVRRDRPVRPVRRQRRRVPRLPGAGGHRRPGHRARQRRGADPGQRPGRLRHRRRRRRTCTTRRGSRTTRWCCTCRCATCRRRSSSPRPTSSTTSSTA